MSDVAHYQQPPSDLDARLDVNAFDEVANHGFPLVPQSDCARGWIPDPPRLSSNAAKTTCAPHTSDLALTGVYQPEPVRSTNHHYYFCPTPPSDQTTPVSRHPPFPHSEQKTPHFWSPPAHHHRSDYEGEARAGTLGPNSVPTVSSPCTFEGATSQNFTDTMFPSSRVSGFAHDESPFERRWACYAERGGATATCEYPSPDIRNNNFPLAVVTDNPNGYNQDWSSWDMIAFNGFLRDEVEVPCQWVENTTLCNDRVKGKDFTDHLRRKHGITYDSQVYQCLWHTCPVSLPMRKSSLERHVKEQHLPVKWACPTCPVTFTRKSTLMRHFEQCTSHV